MYKRLKHVVEFRIGFGIAGGYGASGSSGSPPPSEGYDIAARLAALRADSRISDLLTDESDYMTPNGAVLPTDPTTTTTHTAADIAELNTLAAGSGRHITLTPGSHAGAISITGQDIDIVLTGCTVTPPVNTTGLTTAAGSRRIRVTGGTIIGVRYAYGQDIQIIDTQFLCLGTFSGGAGGHGGVVAAHRYLELGLTVRKASNAWFYTGPAVEAQFAGSCTGTTLTVDSFLPGSGPIEVGQYVVALSGSTWTAATRVEEQLTGTTGGAGTYRLSTAQTVAYANHQMWRRSTNLIMANCDVQVTLQPRLVITNMTQANPVVVTYTGDFDPENGNTCNIRQVVGMTQANSLSGATIANVNAGANTFELQGVDGTAWSAYVSGGIAEATWPEENAVRFNGTNIGLILDSRIDAAEKFSWRAHGDYTNRESSRAIVICNVQSERIGGYSEEPGGFGVNPAVNGQVVIDWKLYRSTANNTGGLLVIPRLSLMSNISGVTGNGTTATITFQWAHGIPAGSPITVNIVNAVDSAFNATGVTLTRVDALTASYPSSATGSTGYCQVQTTRVVTEDFRMYDSTSYSAGPGGSEGTAGAGLVPGGYGSPYASWSTCSDAATSLANGNSYAAYEAPPAWAFHTETPV